MTKKAIDINEAVDYYRHKGKEFGYPKCCVDAFVEEVKEYEATGTIASRNNPSIREKWALHGFVPCETHAKFIEANGYAAMVEEIQKKRECPYPFPFDEATITNLVMIPFAKALQEMKSESNNTHTAAENCVCPDCSSKSPS